MSEFIVFGRVCHESCCVEKFVDKRMGVHAFILKQYGMKTNRDWTRIDSQGAAACEFLGTFFEPSHAQPLVFIF